MQYFIGIRLIMDPRLLGKKKKRLLSNGFSYGAFCNQTELYSAILDVTPGRNFSAVSVLLKYLELNTVPFNTADYYYY